MAIATQGTASNYLQRAPSPSGLADEIADELGAELPFETIRYTVRALRLLESRLADPEPVFIPSASP